MPSVAPQVIEIIQRYATPGHRIRPEDRLQDLKIDSLSFMELLFDLEEAFGIKIDLNANRAAEYAVEWGDVGSAVASVQRLVDARGAAGRD